MNEKNMKIEKKYNASFLSLAFFIFLSSYMIVPERASTEIVAFFSVIVLFILLKKINLKITLHSLSLFLYGMYCVFITFFKQYNVNEKWAYEFMFILLMCFLLSLLPVNETTIVSFFKPIIWVSIVSFVGCIFQFIIPNFLHSINAKTLGGEKYAMFVDFFNGGYMVGFSYQTAVTGFYLSILAGWILVNALFSKNIKRKILLSSLLMVIIFLIFMTAKRIFIVIVTLNLLLLFIMKNKKNSIKIIMLCVIICLFLRMLLTTTDVGGELIDRMERIDPTRGRSQLYSIMINIFCKNPIFGSGVGSTLYYIRDHSNGHNIYLQILSETGIIGFLVLVPQMVVQLFITAKKYYCDLKNNKINITLAFSLFVQLVFMGWGVTGNPLYDVYPLIIYTVCIKALDVEHET